MESTTGQRGFYVQVQSAPGFFSDFYVHPKAEGEVSFLLSLKIQ
jgi:hypothetical protein